MRTVMRLVGRSPVRQTDLERGRTTPFASQRAGVQVARIAGMLLLLCAAARAAPGPGTLEEPRRVDAFPYADAYDTELGQGRIDRYDCAPNTDESGPEVVYELVTDRPGRLVAWVEGDDYRDTDIDVHLLDRIDVAARVAQGCLARSNLAIEVDLPDAGTYFVVVDSYDGTDLAGPYELRIDFIGFDEWRERHVGRGVLWRQRLYPDLDGRFQTVNELVLDLSDPEVALRPYQADGCQTVPDMARQAGAVAAVNAGFFGSGCTPVGLVKIDGNLLATNPRERACLGVDPGGQALIDWVEGGQDWPAARDALGGAPMLVIDGQVNVTWQREGLSESFTTNRHPRTAACLDAAGRVHFVTFDGRTEAGAGMSLPDLADWLAGRGCVQALNYDGGGSTTMWVAAAPFGGVVNYPSDNREADHEGARAVSNAWLVFATPYNHPPRFTTDPPLEATDASPYFYDADALDLDLEPLEFGLASGPDGARVEAATGELTWRPTWRTPGPVDFDLTVTDGTNTVHQTFQVNVTLRDQDGDGLPDGWEEEFGTDPTRPDADEDPDADGHTNRQEYEEGTDPMSPDGLEPDAGTSGSPDAADAGGSSDTDPGCGCRSGPAPSNWTWWLGLAGALLARSRRWRHVRRKERPAGKS